MPVQPPGARPLQARTVLLACSDKLMEELAAGVGAMGADVIRFPAIQARELEDTRLLDASIAALPRYAWIIFTSAYAVLFFSRRLQALHGTPDPASLPKICAIGPATAAAAASCGFPVTLTADTFTAEGVLEALQRYYGSPEGLTQLRLFIPRAREAREFLPEALAAAGNTVDVAPCYETVRPEMDAAILKRLREKRPDLLVFTSASTIRNMVETLGFKDARELMQNSAVAVIGPVTGKAAESYGKHADIIPETSTVAGLLRAIGDYFAGA